MNPAARVDPFAARKAAFDLLYRSVGDSPTLRQIWRDAYGDDYPEEAEPLSYVTRPQLELVTRLLQLAPGGRLLDLGCGMGGPGRFVARRTGAHLVGVDISPVAIAQASARAARAGPAMRCRYQLGSADDTRLPSSSQGGALSIDVLQIVPDPQAALAEVARVLAVGGRFAFTSWESDPAPGAVPPHVAARAIPDYRLHLERAGFGIEYYEHPPAGLLPQLAVYRGILAHGAALRIELGAAYDLLAEEAEHDPEWLRRGRVRRVIAVARRL